MTDTATLDNITQNGSRTPSDGKQKGKKRPATRLVSALSGNLTEAKLEYKIAETPTDWAKLKVNTTNTNSWKVRYYWDTSATVRNRV